MEENYKHLCPEVFNFCKSLKMREKNISKSVNFFWFKEKML